jgi:hypothetical protein
VQQSEALRSKAGTNRGEHKMKKLALGVATAALLTAAAVPAMAQVGFYAGPRGFGVGVGAPYYGYDSGYPYNGYYDYYDGPYYGGPSMVIHGGHWHGHHYRRH